MAYYENITLEKGMYSTPGKSLAQVLEDLDPSENYRGTPLEGLDAYQRQLRRFDIKASGPGCGSVESFFQNSNTAVLFPEYVARAVRQGMENASKISDMTAVITEISAPDYAGVSVNEAGNSAVFSETKVTANSELVPIKKRGRMLTVPYEAIRFQKLDYFTVILRQIGAYLAAQQLRDAAQAILRGVYTSRFCKISALCYDDFIRLWGDLAPYNMNTIVAGTEAMQAIMRIPEFKSTQGRNPFYDGLGTPAGAKLIHIPGLEEHRIIALDKNYALQMVQCGGIELDADRLIDRQLERAAISVTYGFARMFQNAAVGLYYGIK